MKQVYLAILVLTLFCGCASVPDHPVKSPALPPISPDYTAVTIPVGIAPLNFYIDNDSVDRLYVVAEGSDGDRLTCSGDVTDFDIDEWHALIGRHAGDSIIITVSARKDGQWTEYQPFPVYVSSDSLGQWGVTYRLIPPGYETYGVMGIYQRDLSNFDETPVLDNQQVDGNCMNCHTTNMTDPSQFTFHIRGEHGATVVGYDGQTDILEPRNQELGGGMVYPYWHPSGQYVAYSTNQTHQNFYQLAQRRVEVYDDKSDILIYNTRTHEILLDSIVATADHLENYPVFSPDGSMLYFCSAQRVDSIWKQYEEVKYNICRVAFDAATGRLGTHVDTIVNARSMGKSANMPRLSYDGRFLLFTMSDYGCFPIWHPEADLWIIDLSRFEVRGTRYEDSAEADSSGVKGNLAPRTSQLAARNMKEINSTDAESFHNWSRNSRWILFTSRRDNGLYTQLYLAHVDADGHASKPFRLPQRNPREYDAETVYSFNTPDFATSPIDLVGQNIYQRLLSTERTPTVLKRY